MGRQDEEESTPVPGKVIVKLGDIESIKSGIAAITSFSGSITKIVINDTQVYPGAGSIELIPDTVMTIKVSYSVTPAGDIAANDYWTVGVTAKLDTQFGWDPTRHLGGGTKTGTPEIGNLKAAAGTLDIKLYAIDAINPAAPAG